VHRFVYILQHPKIKVNKILFNFQLSFVGTILQPYKFIFVQLDEYFSIIFEYTPLQAIKNTLIFGQGV
jgi:hypothetical protein